MKFLGPDLVNNNGVSAFGSGPITSVRSVLASDVTIGSTMTTGPSVSLAAGTWLVMATHQYSRTTTTAQQVSTQILAGSSVAAIVIDYHGSINVMNLSQFLSAIVTLGATTTVALQSMCNSGGSLMRGSTWFPAPATSITAIRLA